MSGDEVKEIVTRIQQVSKLWWNLCFSINILKEANISENVDELPIRCMPITIEELEKFHWAMTKAMQTIYKLSEKIQTE